MRTAVREGPFCFAAKAAPHVTVDQYGVPFFRNTVLLLLPGAIFLLTDRSEDFSDDVLRLLVRSLFGGGGLPAGSRCFSELCANSPFLGCSSGWPRGFDLVPDGGIHLPGPGQHVSQHDHPKPPAERAARISTRCSVSARRPESSEITTRQTELFHRFVSLVHEHCTREREVTFYADRLCISTRYLSTIVRSVAQTTAKEFIDHTVALEIKMLLQSTDLSVQEIAYRLHFPDQSYLGTALLADPRRELLAPRPDGIRHVRKRRSEFMGKIAREPDPF